MLEQARGLITLLNFTAERAGLPSLSKGGVPAGS